MGQPSFIKNIQFWLIFPKLFFKVDVVVDKKWEAQDSVAGVLD